MRACGARILQRRPAVGPIVCKRPPGADMCSQPGAAPHGKAGRRGEKRGEQRRQRVQGGVPGSVHGLCPARPLQGFVGCV